MNTNIIVVFTLILTLTFFFYNLSSNESSETIVEKPTKSLALIMSFDCCKKILKAPATAQFEYGGEENKVLKINDYTFELANYVDSQNSFGAMIRSKYYCKLTFDKKGMVTCNECFIVPER